MKSITPTLSFILFVSGIHLAIMYSFLPDRNITLLLGIHGVLSFFLLIGQIAVKKVKSIDPEKVGMTFLAITVFKMLFSLVFIMLVFKLTEISKLVLIGNFFTAFFVYLAYEVYLALKELK